MARPARLRATAQKRTVERRIKRAYPVIRRGIEMDFAAASELEAKEFGKQFGDPVTQEGMKAFLEKRKPNWV